MVRRTPRVIPLVDVARQYRSIQREAVRATTRILRSGCYILGPEVAAFEREVARFSGTRYGIGVASGTDALELALRALHIGPGDEVITSPFTFIATVEAIIAAGARPVFADIDPVTFTLNPELVKRRLTRRTRAIIPVHLYGQPAEMDAFVRLARRARVRLIEDCAQAIGARYHGHHVGAFGDAGCFSFYPAKNLGACGDAGGVVTKHRRVAERIRMLRDHGSRQRYHHLFQGMNSRLDELQAALLRIKLRRLRRWTRQRQQVARWYTQAFRGAGVPWDALPREAEARTHVYHQYVVRSWHRSRLRQSCQRLGVATGTHYPIPLHREPALRWLGYPRGAFPHSERAAREVISLPMFPEMQQREVRRVVRATSRWLR